MKKLGAVFILFFAILTQSFAATSCDNLNILANYGIIGNKGFEYGNNSVINSGTIVGAGNTPTPTGLVTTVHPTFPPFEPALFPATGTTSLSNQTTINPGSYGKIKIDQNNLTTTFTAGTYYINELVLSKNNATAQLAPGDYFINKLSMGDNAYITVNPSGPVRIFINSSFTGGNQIGINANGSVQNMTIYLYSGAKVEIGNGNQGNQQTLNFNGTIYSPFANTEIQFGNNNDIQGAILSAGKVDVGTNTTFNYSTAVQAAVTDAFGCYLPQIPIAEYRMDECSWNGSAGEVRDSESSNHGTSKALNGDSRVATTNGSGKVDRAGEFKGEGYNADPYNAWYQASYYVEIPDRDSLSPLSITQSAQMSITGWFNLNNTNDTHTIVHKGGQNQEYRVFIEGGKLKFTVWNIWGGSNTIVVNQSLNANQYYFFTVTAKPDNLWSLNMTAYVKEGSSTYSQTGLSLLFTYNLFKDGKLYLGATNWGGITNFLNGYIDEIKIYNKALSSYDIEKLYAYESSGLNYDGTARTPSSCGINNTQNVLFDGWDSFRSLADRNISTKIVNRPFNLTIASLNSTNTALQDFSGTVCAEIVDSSGNAISGWNKVLFSGAKSATTTFTINRAIGGNDSAGVKLYWKKNIDSTCPLLSEDNSTMASDRFAIRPASFTISAPNAIAGTNFNINFTAPIYGAVTGSSDYNETSGETFDVSIAEHNASCLTGIFNPVPNSGWSFSNGSKILTTRYSEVGMVDVNMSDTAKPCAARYAHVDCDDANVSDGINFSADLLPIGLTSTQITIKPHHFDVNATLTNFAHGNFTYLSTDLNMSSTLNVAVTAKNGEGNTTKNYDKGCYATSTTLTLAHSAVPNPLTKILYAESLSGIDGNITKSSDIVLNFGNTIFTQGAAPLRLALNFDRSVPLNPFDFNITSVSIKETNDANVNNIAGINTMLGTANFVYGRVRAYDVTNNVGYAPNPVEFEVYSTTSFGYVSGMPQNVLHWYRNTNHANTGQGNVIRGGFNAGVSDSAVVPSGLLQNGIQNVDVTSLVNQTVHLDISPWLWYSPNPVKIYNYGTDCTQHPCFRYNYTTSGGVTGVNTGTFQGSDFEMAPAKNITNKGVKLFR